MELLLNMVLVGVGATAVTDLWSVARWRLFGIAPPDFGLVGRWIAHLPRGRFRHASIAATPVVRGERLIGWLAHYLIGIAFAGILLALWGVEWIWQPRLGPALFVGAGTVVAPLFLMQPGMGHAFSARRAMHSLVTHLVFGVGLYLAGCLTNVIFH